MTPKFTRVILALSLFLLSSTQAATQKNYNIQLEALRLGFGPSYIENGRADEWVDGRLGTLTFSYYRLRFGASLLAELPQGNSILPVEAGITIYQRPKPYVWFRGMVPDVYAVVGYYWANGLIDDNPFDPAWKFGVRCEADYWGVGYGAELAYIYSTSRNFWGRHVEKGVAASLYLRFLTTNFGF